jgi:anti-sigma regulatory factor (Ser/Thr protein kinase)
MEMSSHRVLSVADRSHVSGARRDASLEAERAGFSATDAHRVGIVATELASNLAKHAGNGGEILLRTRRNHVTEIELVSLDRGRGIADIPKSLEDGHSTAGSAGTGLGAVRRMADDFDIYSQPGHGTAVLARLRSGRPTAPAADTFLCAGVSVAMAGESVCGDTWVVATDRGRHMVGIVDGLGHGLLAREAATAAARTITSRPWSTALDAVQAMHDGSRHTRGSAATVVVVDPRETIALVAGIGNVAAAFVEPPAVRRAVSMGGILGHEVRAMREYRYPWTRETMLVMHSDGLTSHWSLDGYPGIRQRDPLLAAAVLYRDFQRGRDDVTVVVGREAAA